MPMVANNRGGAEYTPELLMAIDEAKCIGCRRCYKVCGRDVLTLKGITDDGMIVELDDEEYADDIERRVMVMANADNCIGCGACNRVCPSDCQTHAALD